MSVEPVEFESVTTRHGSCTFGHLLAPTGAGSSSAPELNHTASSTGPHRGKRHSHPGWWQSGGAQERRTQITSTTKPY